MATAGFWVSAAAPHASWRCDSPSRRLPGRRHCMLGFYHVHRGPPVDPDAVALRAVCGLGPSCTSHLIRAEALLVVYRGRPLAVYHSEGERLLGVNEGGMLEQAG